jgi:putative transposase
LANEKAKPVRNVKTSPEGIRFAMIRCIRFPRSLRNVEDLLHEHGIEISHESVRFWWNLFARSMRVRSAVGASRTCGRSITGQWHHDEVFVEINGIRIACGARSIMKARCWKPSSASGGTARRR